MPISVQCESCFQTYRVGDDKAGKAIKCKDCGGRIQVPSRKGASDDDDSAVVARPAARPQRRSGSKKKQGTGPNKSLLIGGAAAGVVVLGLVGFLLMRGGGAAQQGGAAGSGASVTPDPGAIAGWKVTADPPANPVNWPDKLSVAITIPGKAMMM